MSETNSDKKQGFRPEKTSKVLLVCVYDTVVFEITEQIICSKFGQMGSITKLLIFEKGEVTKFFIEFSELQSALQARKHLDGTKLFDTICKMSIYFSNFTNVDIKHEAEQNCVNSHETQQIEPKLYEISGKTRSTNKEKQQHQLLLDQDNIMKAFGGGLSEGFDDFHRSKTDDPKTLQELHRINSFHRSMDEEEQLDSNIQKSIDSLLCNHLESKEQAKKSAESQVKLNFNSDLRSEILCFALQHKCKPEHIYNLFSNFGNISCIVVKKEQAYVKFRTKEFAAIAVAYLNNTIINRNKMLLKEFPSASSLWRPRENQYCQARYYDESFDRFTPQRSITINPPSHTIHVSSMKKQICQQKVLMDIFQQFGVVQKVHILQQSNERNMALVKFSSTQDSFKAIANLHNEVFAGRKMQISFTKSRV